LTDAAVRRYQTEAWLVVDGIVGPCTWNALLDQEDYNLRFPTAYVKQPTATTCWRAATAMLLNRPYASITNGPAALCADGSIDISASNLEVYAKFQGLTMNYPMSWLPAALANRMRSNGRLMFIIVWNLSAWSPRISVAGHLVVLAGMRGDSTAEGTTLMFYDPLDGIIPLTYRMLLSKIPGATAYVMYR
jgi:peptidoglycan hydrolase-like protein with peptidoglycan-binding domain